MLNKQTIQSNIRTAINCWLRYVLSQPVEIDIEMVLLLLAKSSGISSILASLSKVKDDLTTIVNSFNKRTTHPEPLAYNVE